MSKESSQPKALNILRPTQSLTATHKSNSSILSFQRKPRVTTAAHVSTAEKPQLNIYHPPAPSSRGSSVVSSSNIYRSTSYRGVEAAGEQPIRRYSGVVQTVPTKERPPIEIYKPGSATIPPRIPTSAQPNKTSSMTKSYTAPAISAKYVHASSRPLPPSQIPNSTNAGSSSVSVSAPTVASDQPSVSGLVTANSSLNISAVYNTDEYSPTTPDSEHQLYTTKEDPYDTFGGDEEDGFSDDSAKSPIASDDEGSNDEAILNEARVNRQIADLEISNQSLLAVNAMLEATVRKQALEVAKLKKQLNGTDQQGDLIAPFAPPPLPTTDFSEDEWENDKVFQRLCQMTDSLIEHAQAAVAFEVKGMGRVISQYNLLDDDDDLEK